MMTHLWKCLRKIMDSEAIRYIVVGGCTTLVNLFAFTFLCKVIHMDVTISNIISVITAILFAYITNKMFVFQSHCHSLKELWFEFSKFVGARLFTMIIEVGGVFLLFNMIGQDEIIAKLETQIIVLIGNYIISKFLVFKGKEVR